MECCTQQSRRHAPSASSGMVAMPYSRRNVALQQACFNAKIGQHRCPNRFDPRCAPGFPRGRAPQARRRRRATCFCRSARRATAAPPRRASGPSASAKSRIAASVAAALHSPSTAFSAACAPRRTSRGRLAKQRRRLLVDRQRPLGKQERRAVGEFDQRLGALLQPGHRRQQLRLALRRPGASAIAAPFSR